MGILVECIGWLGAILVLLAYVLISLNKIESSTPSFQWLNLVGAICLIVHTIYNHAYPSAFVNIVWTGVAIYGLIKVRLKD
jgi:hypothetical protein